MAIQREIWQSHIEGNLFKNNEFLLASTDASHHVLNGHMVHIPQAGAVPGVEKDRLSLPATVTQRTDVDITYTLSEYTTDPILIPNAESYELSYSKRESVLGESQAALRERIAEGLLREWAPSMAARIIRTSGTDIDAHLDGTIGTRKRFLAKDLKTAQLTMNKQNIPMEGRYALMSADMFEQLTNDITVAEYPDFGTAYDVKNGVLGRLFGFNIMLRSSVLVYSDDATPVASAYGAAVADTDNDAVLCWQEHCVERALGTVDFFERLKDPTYYGDVYSIAVRMGGRKRRNDQKGTLVIVQDA
ncbi:hypothetical protein GCM10023093_16930 [Nemorincola caseinilytica]|uniref:Uncharacterized protein n=1 Tax=Nemorincola caseinilytica TaxID=2054315 RepID=A0ABP8NFU7_9BACT